jgi:signal transduction histidine kinase
MTQDTALVQKDGTILPVIDSAAPIFEDGGKVVACVVVFRDATRERRLEEMRREFVSVVSHQLRTPLSGVKWIVELLLQKKAGPMTARQEELLTQARTSNERMIHLVGDLLNVSRIEQGKKLDLQLVAVNICDVIREAITDLEHFAQQHEVGIHTANLLPTYLQATCDSEKVREIFHNLIDNAIKYSDPGSRVEVGLEKQERTAATFFVRDHGIGNSPKEQKRLFEKYFRGTAARAKFTDGTGLGLYVCRALVLAHGGKIWFESKLNQGTTFYVQLPTTLTPNQPAHVSPGRRKS